MGYDSNIKRSTAERRRRLVCFVSMAGLALAAVVLAPFLHEADMSSSNVRVISDSPPSSTDGSISSPKLKEAKNIREQHAPLLRSEEANLSWNEKSQPILKEFPPIGRRLEFIHHLEKLPSYKTAIEVGVQKGILAKKSLDIWKSCTEYKLVDLWGKEEGYEEPGTDTAADKDSNLRQARGRMKKWVDIEIVEFFVMRSTDAAKYFADNHFDYIYLDARHDYCAVKEDIEHYWPKLRPGGIMGGHDYIDSQYAIDKLGTMEDWSKCENGSIHPEAVRGAVDEFRHQQGGLEVYTSNEDFPSWYIQKPY